MTALTTKRIAREKRKGENFEDSGIGKVEIVFIEALLAIAYQRPPLTVEADGMGDFWEVGVDYVGQEILAYCMLCFSTGMGIGPFGDKAIDAVGVLVILVIAEFILHIKHYQNATSHAHG